MSKKKLPPCGLYRTGRPLQNHESDIPAGILVMFHNHSNRNIPFLQLPEENVRNVWSFQEHGPGIENDDKFIQALQPLRDQGFYFLREPLQVTDGVLPAYTIIQLGYNPQAEPILFRGSRSQYTNALIFPEIGYGFNSLEVLDILAPESPLGVGDEDIHDQDSHVSAEEGGTPSPSGVLN